MERGSLVLPGGDPLPDAPWVLERDDAELSDLPSVLRFVGSSSRRSRATELFLTVDAQASLLGRSRLVPGTNRTVLCITARCFWHDKHGGPQLLLAPGENADESRPLALHPHRPNWTVLAPYVSLGLPGLGATQGTLQWRRSRQEPWRRLERWPIGRIQLASVRDNLVWDSAELAVLPAGASISAKRAGRGRTPLDIMELGPDVAIDCAAEVERS